MMPEEYTMHMGLLCSQARIISQLPLEEMLRIIDKADAVGPVIDPTAYRSGMDGLREQRKLVEASLRLKRMVALSVAGGDVEEMGDSTT